MWCKSFDETDLLTTFKRLGDGGYNTGAAFVMEPDGILVRSSQCSSHPGSVDPASPIDPRPSSHSPSEQQPPAAAEESVDETLECKICLAPLVDLPCEALLCGHTFHTDCIDRFVRTTGRSRENGCSFKCQLREATVDSIARENSLVTAANEAAMRAAAATTTTTIDDAGEEDEGASSATTID